MTQKTSPFIEVKYGWDLGESGWNEGMDENLKKFSYLFDKTVDGIVSSLPPPSSGQAYFLTSDNRFYFSIESTWYFSPAPKWFQFSLKSTGESYIFDGAGLTSIGIPANNKELLDSIEITVTSLGSAAFKDESYFALSTELDSTELALTAYTDQLRSDLSDMSSGASNVGYRGRTVYERFDEFVSCVDSSQLQILINNFPLVYVPKVATLEVANITIPSDRVLWIDGTLRLSPNSPDNTVLLKNADQVLGNSNIRIIGKGKLDGNKSNQTGATTKHTLVHLKNCTDSEYAVAYATGNYFPTTIVPSNTTGMIFFENCNRCAVHDAKGDDYGRECFWMKLCNNSSMYNLSAVGGVDSWSGMQFSGDYNSAFNWRVENAGASGCSFDCRYSTLNGVVSKNNTFAHAINFGHAGIPADGSRASNLVAIGGSKGGTGNVCNNIQIGASTVGLHVNNFYCQGAPDHGIQVSDGATDISLSNGRIISCGAYGVKLFGNANQKYKLSSIQSTTNTSGGLRIDNGLTVDVSNSDFRGNTTANFGADGSSVWTFSQVRLSDDPMFGSQGIASLSAGTATPVTNGNVTTRSVVVLQPSNLTGSAGRPFPSAISNGSFTITNELATSGGASVRWWVV